MFKIPGVPDLMSLEQVRILSSDTKLLKNDESHFILIKYNMLFQFKQYR